VNAIPRLASVQLVHAAFVGPFAPGQALVMKRHQMRGAIEHGYVYDAAFACRGSLEQGAKNTDHHESTAAAIVANNIKRNAGGAVFGADRMQGAGESDVIDVVSSPQGQRPVLT